ncbi:MAG: hypothetical protein WC924_03535 [Candidatus Gracilibacteria bacterium]
MDAQNTGANEAVDKPGFLSVTTSADIARVRDRFLADLKSLDGMVETPNGSPKMVPVSLLALTAFGEIYGVTICDLGDERAVQRGMDSLALGNNSFLKRPLTWAFLRNLARISAVAAVKELTSANETDRARILRGWVSQIGNGHDFGGPAVAEFYNCLTAALGVVPQEGTAIPTFNPTVSTTVRKEVSGVIPGLNS